MFNCHSGIFLTNLFPYPPKVFSFFPYLVWPVTSAACFASVSLVDLVVFLFSERKWVPANQKPRLLKMSPMTMSLMTMNRRKTHFSQWSKSSGKNAKEIIFTILYFVFFNKIAVMYKRWSPMCCFNSTEFSCNKKYIAK